MAKDYKNSPKPKDKPKGKGKGGGFPGWGWFVLGIIAAILVIKLGPVLYQAEMHAGKKGAAKPGTVAAAATDAGAPFLPACISAWYSTGPSLITSTAAMMPSTNQPQPGKPPDFFFGLSLGFGLFL